MLKKNKIVIIRNKNEINFACKFLKEKIHDYLFIPISAEIIDDLIKKKLKIKVPQEFIENLNRNYTKNNLQKFKDFSVKLDDIVIQNIPEYKNLNIKTFRHSIIYNRHLINNNYALIDFLKNIINSKNYTKILFFFNNKEKENDKFKKIYSNLKFNEKRKFTAIKINLKYNFDIQNNKILEGDKFGINKNYIYNNIKFYLKNFIIKKNVYKDFKNLLSNVNKETRKNILILSSTDSEILPILEKLKKKNSDVKFVFWDTQKEIKVDEININKKKILNCIYKNKKIFNLIKYKGISLFEVIYPDITYFVERYIASFYKNVVLYNQLQKKYNFKLILTQYDNPIFESIFEQSEKNKIPSITILHGGTIGYSENYIYMNEILRESNNFKNLMCYTDTIKKFLTKQSKDFNVKGNFLTVGSSHFRNIKKQNLRVRNNKNKLKICLVLEPITNDLDNFGNNHETYIRTLKTVQIFAHSKNHELFIKTFKNSDENLELFKSIKKNQWNNIKILDNKKKFYEVINKFDLIILSYLGTPFFEVACTKIPSLTYLDEKKILIDKKTLNHIKSRSYIAKSNNDYLNLLLDIKKNVFKSYVLNKDKCNNFLIYNKYCNPKNIQNIDYAVKIINDKISKK